MLMKTFKITICSIILLCSAVNINAQVQKDTDKPIMLTEKQSTFSVSLPSSPSTGYSWVLSGNYNAALIEPVEQHYIILKKDLPGAPRLDKWTFKLSKLAFKAPTHIVLNLQYIRPWEKGSTNQKTLNIVTVPH